MRQSKSAMLIRDGVESGLSKMEPIECRENMKKESKTRTENVRITES